MTTLQYYFVKDKEIRLVVFNKYYIENGIIVNKFYGTPVSYSRNNKYNRCTVSDDEGKRYNINVGRAIASTLYGEPPSTSHTADHIDQNSFNDTSDNIRWLCKSGQNKNRMMDLQKDVDFDERKLIEVQKTLKRIKALLQLSK